MTRRVFVLSFLLVAFASPARAAWPPDGVTLISYYNSPTYMKCARDGAGGVIVWMDMLQSTIRPVYAHRVGADGTHYPGWDFVSGAGTTGFPDGEGGFYKLSPWGYSSYDLRALRIQAQGGCHPNWPSDGVTLFGPFTQIPTGYSAAGDGSGGLYSTMLGKHSPGVPVEDKVFVKRTLTDATQAPGWPTAGVQVHDGFYGYVGAARVASDGAGGALVAWSAQSSGPPQSYLFVQRVTPSGVEDVNWPYGGAFATADYSTYSEPLTILLSGPDHFFLSWQPTPSHLRLQRMKLLDGGVAEGWPDVGFQILSGLSGSNFLTVLGDGLDGALIVWDDGTTLRGRRILPDGSDAPGWPSSGLPLLGPTAATPRSGRGIAPHEGGGLSVAFTDTDGRMRVRWLLADGTPDPAQPVGGRVASISGDAGVYGAVSDGYGGAFVTWFKYNGWPTTGLYSDFRVSWVPYDPALVSVPEPSTSSLALTRVWPNPGRQELNLRFALGDDSPARLELIDVAGHRVRSMDVRGAGEHVKRFERLDALSAGVYFVRLTHRGRTSTSRVALVH